MTNFDETKITGLIDPSKLHVEIEETSLQIQVGIQSSGPQGKPGERGPEGPMGPMGTSNYTDLLNRPSIESIELTGNKTFEDLGIISITKSDIINIF